MLEFLLEHWLLSSLLPLGLVILLWNEWQSRLPSGVLRFGPDQVIQTINHQEGQLVDIRDAEAFKAGHIVGAISMPFAELIAGNSNLGRYKTKPLVLVCAVGQDSLKAVRHLRKAGVQHLAFLNGGMRSWTNAALPLVRPNSANSA